MQFTIIEAREPALLTKEFKRSSNGLLTKVTHPYLTKGTATALEVNSMQEFGTIVLRLRHNEALVYGCCEHRRADVVTKAAWRTLSDQAKATTVARSGDFFAFHDGPGIWMLDIDDDAEGNLIPPETALSLLDQHLPEAQGVPRLILPSASSHICDSKTGEDLTGLCGYRIYVPVDDARAIPHLATTLYTRLIAAGHRLADVTKDGKIRIKTLHDMTVHHPWSMDFASGATVGAGLEQRNREPRLINPDGPPLQTSQVVLSAADRQSENIALEQLKAGVKARAAEVKATWTKEKKQGLVSKGISSPKASRIIERATNGVLSGEFVLQIMKGAGEEPNRITVVEILNATNEYDGWYALDPMGTAGDTSQAYGTLLLKKRKPELSAFESGDPSYQLVDRVDAVDPDLRKIHIAEGKLSSAVDATIVAIASTGRFFNMGSALVDVQSGAAEALDADQTAYCLGAMIDYTRDARAGRDKYIQRCDPPEKLCRQLLKHQRPELPALNAMVDRPMPRPDGSLIENAGYDEKTHLYVSRGLDEFRTFNPNPSADDLKSAIATCFAPFREYRLDEFGKTAVLAAVLTAVIRPGLDLAPAILIRCPEIGAGKTAAALAFANITEAKQTSVQVKPEGEAEMGKRLLSLLLASTGVILFDNADGALRSKKLAALVTSATWSDRELGRSSMREDLPNRALLVINGRNVAPSDGFSRRVIPMNIVPQRRSDMMRTFAFSPDALAAETRDDIIGAALTLIAAVPEDFTCVGRVPTFAQWDRHVRRTVAWLRTVDGSLFDPLELIMSELRADSEIDGRLGLLEFIATLIEKGLAEEFRAVDVLNTAREHDMLAELQEHLEAISASAPSMSSRSIGVIFGLIKNQDLEGARLVGVTRRGLTVWRIERADEPVPA